MAKKLHLLYLIPLTFLISGCSFSFSKEEHDEGIEDGEIKDQEKIEYYEQYGDVFTAQDDDSHSINIFPNASEQGADYTSENQSEILALFDDQDGLLASVDAAQYVAIGVGGLKVGHINTSLNGLIDISLAETVNATFVEIYAMPRSASVYAQTGTVETIDTPVAISLNDSKYVRLDTDFSTIAEIEETKCSYELAEGADHLQVKVYGQRAILTRIVIYTAGE